MKMKQLIETLSEFPEDCEVVLTDGYGVKLPVKFVVSPLWDGLSQKLFAGVMIYNEDETVSTNP